MNLLVTGGAGFIGSNFIRLLLDQRPEVKVINLDLLTYAGNLDNLKDVSDNPNYRFVHGDIADEKLVDEIAKEGLDGIINFAAESHVDRSIEDPQIFLRTNILGTYVLLEAAKKYDVPRFLQISTDEVYGSLGPTGLFTEESPLAPNSPYSASKTSADLIVRAYHHTYGLATMVSRCSNNYGPYQYPEKAIPLFITNLMDGLKIPLYGDGLNVRDWLHVDDHCRAVLMVFEKGKVGEVYNIGGNNEKKNIEIVQIILKELGAPESMISYVKDRPGHDRRYAIDSTKIQKELGWKPSYDFDSGIQSTIRWYQENRWWWEKLISRSSIAVH